MNSLIKTALFCLVISLMFSCNVLKKPKEGCPSNGKNVGAEKLMDILDEGNKGFKKAKIPKAKKFRD